MKKPPKKPGPDPSPKEQPQHEQLKSLLMEAVVSLTVRRDHADRSRSYLREVFIPDLMELKQDGVSEEISSFFAAWQKYDQEMMQRGEKARRAIRQEKDEKVACGIAEKFFREDLTALNQSFWHIFEKTPTDNPTLSPMLGRIAEFMLYICMQEMKDMYSTLASVNFYLKFPHDIEIEVEEEPPPEEE